MFSTCGSRTGIDMVCRIGDILSAVLPVLVALGVVYFVWGVVQYFIANSEEAKGAGKDRIIYGIIGLAVIVAVWGLVAVLTRTFFPNGAMPAPNSNELQNLLPH